jgi:hypothetical protein
MLLELESKEFEVDKEFFFGSTTRLNLNLFRFRFIFFRIDYPLNLILD